MQLTVTVIISQYIYIYIVLWHRLRKPIKIMKILVMIVFKIYWKYNFYIKIDGRRDNVYEIQDQTIILKWLPVLISQVSRDIPLGGGR